MQLQWRIEERAADPGRGRLFLACEHLGVDHGQGRRECGFGLWALPAAGPTWCWDGNREAPSITPSIDCKGGCGRHFVMTRGVANG